LRKDASSAAADISRRLLRMIGQSAREIHHQQWSTGLIRQSQLTHATQRQTSAQNTMNFIAEISMKKFPIAAKRRD
jgi:hypothetical protein